MKKVPLHKGLFRHFVKNNNRRNVKNDEFTKLANRLPR